MREGIGGETAIVVKQSFFNQVHAVLPEPVTSGRVLSASRPAFMTDGTYNQDRVSVPQSGPSALSQASSGVEAMRHEAHAGSG
jgi:hypothetical protein